jgi:DNA polymerase III epsilon subunit-like protein
MILFDTETTGLLQPDAVPLNGQPKIIEFAAIKLNDKTLKEVGRLEFLCNPGAPLPEIITKITGITDADLADLPGFDAHYADLCEFFLGERNLVAHNITFDVGMLKNDLLRIGKSTMFPWPQNQLCTIDSSYSIRGRRLKLSILHEMVTGAPHVDAHRAMADVEALVTCARWLIKENLMKIQQAPAKAKAR